MKSTSSKPSKKKKEDKRVEDYHDRLEAAQEQALIREAQIAEHNKELKALKAEKLARKKEKHKIDCMCNEAFTDLVKKLDEKYDCEHRLEWDEEQSHVHVVCTTKYCHFKISFNYKLSKEFCPRPD